MSGLNMDVGPGRGKQTCAVECAEQGCQYTKGKEMMQQAAAIIEKATRLQKKAETAKERWYRPATYERMEEVATALWCDRCEQPYSNKDPKRRQVQQSSYDEDGDRVTVTLDLCGVCATQMWARPAIEKGVQDAVPVAEDV